MATVTVGRGIDIMTNEKHCGQPGPLFAVIYGLTSGQKFSEETGQAPSIDLGGNVPGELFVVRITSSASFIFDAIARLSGGIVAAVLRLVYHLHPTSVA